MKKKISIILFRCLYLVVPVLFFVLAIITMRDYGMNWDSPVHFARGQAYLWYLTTGKTNYQHLPPFCTNKDNLNSRVDFTTGDVCDRHRENKRSEYESDLVGFTWVQTITYGHPPFSDILSAVSNQIFFKGLGWMEDIDAYNFFNVLITFFLACLVAYWMKQTYGLFASVVSVIVMYTYPLLVTEQHINIKDPAMAAFFTAAIYFFWRGITTNRAQLILISAVFGGMSVGTKFNFVFAPFIIAPWLLSYLYFEKYRPAKKKSIWKRIPKKYLLVFLLYPVIVLGILYATWPALWQKPVTEFMTVVKYYKEIGGTSCDHFPLTPGWIFTCSEKLPLTYFMYTLPIVSLTLFTIGYIIGLFSLKKYGYLPLLLIVFITVTLLRVTLPFTSVYGGIRLIMEFIAPFAMLSGIGALFIRERIMVLLQKSELPFARTMISGIILFLFIPITFTLISLHPNQNLFFNALAGGLKGAAEKNIEGYGNTYGNIYLQAVNWLNKNGEKNSFIAILFGNSQNISRAQLREDFVFSNAHRSGYTQKGEYQIVPYPVRQEDEQSFRLAYAEKFLKPVHVIQVDGVELLKIWKNDPRYLITPDIFDEKEIPVSLTLDKKSYQLVLDGEVPLKRLEIHGISPACEEAIMLAEVYTSRDGSSFTRRPELFQNFTYDEIKGNIDYSGKPSDEAKQYTGRATYLFAGNRARQVNVVLSDPALCPLTEKNISVYYLTNASFLDLVAQ